MTADPGNPTQNDLHLPAALAKAVDALGRNDFYDRLLEIVGAVAAHDLAALVRYSRSVPPDLIIPRIEPTEAMLSYHRHFYVFDPFHTHWASGGEIGVYRLRTLAAGIGRSRYAREFLSAMAIHDEIAVFLPPLGEAAPTLILDRAAGPFTEREVGKVRALFPLLAALHRRHLSLFVTAGIALDASPIGNERPLRLLDQRGRQIFATEAWAGIIGRGDGALKTALDQLDQRGPCVLQLPGPLTLRRSHLPADFGPAPGGFCDEITPDGARLPAGAALVLPTPLAARLSDREQQVVLLTLQGHPVIDIARKLSLSRGTVKNYRLHIYRKLDITTERELFGEYMHAANGQG